MCRDIEGVVQETMCDAMTETDDDDNSTPTHDLLNGRRERERITIMILVLDQKRRILSQGIESKLKFIYLYILNEID
jgi:hypothetical protein